jgi:clostripain
LDTISAGGAEYPYGKLAWCMDGSEPNDDVDNWFELLDYWFDELYDTDWNDYSI